MVSHDPLVEETVSKSTSLVAKLKGFGFRHRYFFTRNGLLRMRFIVSFALSVVTFSTLFFTGDLPLHIDIRLKTADASQSSVQNGLEKFLAMVEEESRHDQALMDQAMEDNAKADEAAHQALLLASAQKILPAPQKPDRRVFTIQSGDSLGGILERAAISKAEAYKIVEAIRDTFNPRDMKVGQKVMVDVEKVAGEPVFKGLYIQKSQLDYVKLAKAESTSEPQYDVQALKRKFEMKMGYAETRIDENASSLYYALRKQDVPVEIISQLIQNYSWDIDFQRDIHPGNTVKVYYEHAVLPNGEHVSGKGKLLFANLKTFYGEHPMYRLERENGHSDYFNDKGESVRKALLSTPIDGARISSGYGMRKHPVSGYTKMHKGVDFAASSGTPIYAAGNGVIERANVFSTYGNYVKIRHNGDLSTAYAHLKSFAKGIRAGVRVSQGDVIGYVGTTGRSTGPHLHYEVMKAGKQVNPNSLKLPTGEKLADKDFKRFMEVRSDIDRKVKALQSDEARIAMLETEN